jgi:pyruvate/2-oxoglutarate dehydrogenase complex dihydrolipoamide acyltransferase (E2) component
VIAMATSTSTSISAVSTAPLVTRAAGDRVEALPLGERWFPDAFHSIPGPGGFALRLVDMTNAMEALKLLREANLRATVTHLVVRAAALALARNPELHQVVCNYRRLTPGTVDIGLSMAGQTTYAPVVVLPEVEKQRLAELVPRSNAAVAAAREKEIRDLEDVRRKGWWVPFGFLRRFILRRLQKTFWFRRKLAGTFQVSCLPNVDVITSFLFYTGSILGAGQVCDRVLARDGQPVVVPTIWLTICVDHASMDGRRAGDLMTALQRILEGTELVAEARAATISA